MQLTFWGAARQVTGSMHLIETLSGYRILIDCGLDYEQQRFFHDNPPNEFPFDPTSIDVVLLTHAHIDHSGNLPNLVRQGFKGHIFCTPPTADLIKHLLLDSANIQAFDYKKSKSKKSKVKKNTPKPLYGHQDVFRCMDKVITLPFHKPFRLNPETEFTFYEAGHLLGAACIHLQYEEDGKTGSIGFTGDLGRNNSQLVRNPERMPDVDYLVTETTYGARSHKTKAPAEDELLAHINETCVNINGKLIIPAFSVGRTQAIVYTLNRLHKKGLLPRIKVFVDSPLALRTTPYYEQYHHLLNEEALAFREKYDDLFHFDELTFVQGIHDEHDLNYTNEPCIIVSAAGMVEGGRIQEHVKNHIGNPFSTILIAGFCAEGTLGHRLLQGQPTVRIKHKEMRVYAQIKSTDVFSSHADQEQLIQNTLAYNSNRLKKVFLVHGDEQAMHIFSSTMQHLHLEKCHTPERGETVTLL